MNYRHAYHAGNFADVLKHVVLMMLVEHLRKKPAPFFYLDTQAGRGLYDLSEAAAQRSGEYKNGIGRVLDAPAAALPVEIAAYAKLVRESAGKGHSAITAYPGSPLIVARMRRPTDRLVLMETQPNEASALRTAVGKAKLVSVLESDGYVALKAQLPPRENRGPVLIHPPYESDLEFDRVLAGLELAHVAPTLCKQTCSQALPGLRRASQQAYGRLHGEHQRHTRRKAGSQSHGS